MKYSVRTVATVLAAASFSTVLAQSSTWCGKNFMPNQTVVLPGGQFQLPPSSDEPLVALRCSPAFRPYLQEDAENVAFIIDTPIVDRYIQGASPITLPSSGSDGLGTMNVTISIDGRVCANQEVPLNITGYEVPLHVSSLPTQKTAYQVTCTATYQGETSSVASSYNHVKPYYSTSASLLYLPDTQGSVVKTDLRTGTVGFYVSFDQYLAKNWSIIDQLKADGFNTVGTHLPSVLFTQSLPTMMLALFEQVANRAAALGLYIIYDMRSCVELPGLERCRSASRYLQLTSLTFFFGRLLTSRMGTLILSMLLRDTYDLIYEMDGYHPVSIALNCQGADIVLENAYPVGINATFSPVWHTECNPYFGHCGCDNCQGSIYDIKARIQTFKDRLDILGYDRTKAVWTTPQAIGSGVYWKTTPTGQQWSAMGITSLSHGATGSMSFQYPTVTGNSTTIEGTSVAFTRVVAEYVQPFIADPKVKHETYDVNGVDAGIWWNGTAYLILVANLNTTTVHVPWASVGLHGITSNDTSQVQRIFSVTQNTNVTGFNFRPGGIGIYTATPPQ
ncbi:hypothetical protein HD554DRAFT_2177530 [Boletus coccyginus]|nr:hypothetical protein HD554DRAFT_2177530 [Boletus coccyginus]